MCNFKLVLFFWLSIYLIICWVFKCGLFFEIFFFVGFLLVFLKVGVEGFLENGCYFDYFVFICWILFMLSKCNLIYE